MVNKEKRVFDISKFTVVGSPTITSDGVASGFSGNDYLTVNTTGFFNNNYNFEIDSKVKYTSDTTTEQEIWDFSWIFRCRIWYTNNKHKLDFYMPYGSNYTNTFAYLEDYGFIDGDDLYIKCISENASSRKLMFSKDGINWNTITNKNTTDKDITSYNLLKIGQYSSTVYWLTNIDLNSFKIYVDNQLVFQPVKTVHLLERLKPKVWNKGQFTIVGNPSISESGVASGFSNDNYLSRNITLDSAKIFDIVFKFRTPETITIGQILGNSGGPAPVSYPVINYRINNNKTIMCEFSITSTTRHYTNSTFTVMGNTDYYGKISYDKTKVIFYISTNAKDWTIIATLNNISDFIGEFTFNEGFGRALGNVAYACPFTGSIDLKQLKIYTDNILVFDGGADTYVYDPSKFTIVGSPTITEYGVMNVDGGANCVKTTKTFNLSEANSWDITTPIFVLSENRTSNASVIGADGIKDGLDIFVRASGQIQWMLFDTIGGASIFVRGLNSSWLNPNILYQMKFKFTGSKYVLLLSTNGGEFIEIDSVESSTKTNINPQFFIGFRGNTGFNGSINLTQFSITVDGQEVFTGAKSIHLLEQRKKLVWDSSQFTEVGNLHIVDDYKNYLYTDNFKAQAGTGNCTAQVLNGGYIGLRGYQGYQPVLINFTGDTPFRLNQLVWRNNPDQGNQGYAPTFYTLTASNDDWATSVTLGTFTASAAKDEAKTFTWDVNSTTAYKSYQMVSDGRHTNGSDGKVGLSITFISFAADYDKDTYDKVNGVASGFSIRDYIQVDKALSNDWGFILPVKITNETTSLQGIARFYSLSNEIVCQIRKEGARVYIAGFGNAVGNFAFNPTYTLNQTLYLKAIKNGNSLTLSYSDNVIDWNDSTFDLTGYTVPDVARIVLGVANPSWESVQGSIDLKQFKIYTDNNLAFDGGKQAYAYAPSKFTVVGSPTITDEGIYTSNLALNTLTNGFTLPVKWGDLKGRSWSIKFRAYGDGTNTSSNPFGYWIQNSNQSLRIAWSMLYWYFRVGDSLDNKDNVFSRMSFPSTAGMYDAILSFNIDTKTYFYKLINVETGEVYNSSTYTATETTSPELYQINESPDVYITWHSFAPNTRMDFKQFSITVDGKEIFTGTKESYYILRS